MSSRIAWTEGMALSPHHFQYADEHVESQFMEESHSRAFGWGLRDFVLDENALRNGVVQIRSCSGYFPDGHFFSVAPGGAGLETRSLAEHLLPSLESIGIYIGQALPIPGRPALGQSYERKEESLPDLLAGGAPRTIGFATPVYRLLFSSEEMSAYRVLKVGEITRDEQGLPALSLQFIPSLVRIGASPLLLSILQKVLDACVEKQTTLRAQRAGAASGNLEPLLLLLALQGSIPVLSHFQTKGLCHPEMLFLELCRLASGLEVYTKAPTGVPGYVHDALGKTFRSLSETIFQALRVEQKMDFSIAVFTQQNPMVYQAAPSWNLTECSSYFLAIRSGLARTQLIQEVGRSIKVSAPTQLQGLVTSAMRGIEISPVDEAPASIRDADKLVFFRIQTSGNFWEEIVRSRNIAAYVTPALQLQEISLIGVR